MSKEPYSFNAVIEPIPGRYFLGVWFMSEPTLAASLRFSDWLCCAFKDKGSDQWEIRYRFAYYEGSEPFARGQDRAEYGAFVKGSEAVVLAKVKTLALLWSQIAQYALSDYVELRTDDASAIMAALRTRPWVHEQKHEDRA